MENEKINLDAEDSAEDVKETNEESKEQKEAKQEEKKEKKEEKQQKKCEKEIEALKNEIKESNDKYLRLAAEYDNFRKRSTKEKSDAYDSAFSDAVKAILPLADSIDKALEFTPDDEGIKALSKQLVNCLEKIGVVAIDSDGKQFDPNFHNAIMHEENEEFGENEIVQTFQKGYLLNEKVIRPAMVKVAN